MIISHFVVLSFTPLAMAIQSIFPPTALWRVELNRTWDALGPFPIHAREQHYLSPSFPLNLSEPVDLNRSWPSSYADGGQVTWSTIQSDTTGNLKVTFPSIRWKSLRSTEGWAALQHHAVLHTSLTVYPPTEPGSIDIPHLLVNLAQGSYLTIIPTDDVNHVISTPAWYLGNIYDLERSLPRAVHFPVPPSLTQPTTYEMFVSGDYEIRLFGDPNVQGSDIPVQSIRLTVELDVPTSTPILEPSQNVVCDFVDGWAFGDAIGVGIRSNSRWWTVEHIHAKNAKGISLTLPRKSRIAPTQTRVIPILITQDQPFNQPEISVEISLTSEGVTKIISALLPVLHLRRWTVSDYHAITATYFYGHSMPTAFRVIPPILEPLRATHPILALHGAGVDIIEMPFWTDSLPRNKRSWIVVPTGRTSWGLDWHGPSALDAWSTLDSLIHILNKNDIWREWKINKNSRAVIIGHSNGGQGAWYLASRYPDRTVAVIPAAGYIKSQAYVPLTMSRSSHFIDPALRAILESSLTPDDNDLHLSNLVDTPILAVHGGSDENVPVWHTREAFGIIQTYSKDADIVLREDPNQGHWYPTILNNAQVDEFLDRVLTSPPRQRSKHFTLTTSAPGETGSLHGWMIKDLIIPGRLGRLHITTTEAGGVQVVTSNINAFSVDTRMNNYASIHIDSSLVSFPPTANGILRFQTIGGTTWQMVHEADHEIQPPSRLQKILTSPGYIIFIIPDLNPSQELSIATRLAHDLHVYHRLDAEIYGEFEASSVLKGTPQHHGSIVFIGAPSSRFVAEILREKRTAFEIKDSKLLLNGQALNGKELAALFLHPYTSATGSMLFMLSTNSHALERAARLFPIRTGIAVPSWILIDSHADYIGAAGIKGAGVWGRGWKWNKVSSWLD